MPSPNTMDKIVLIVAVLGIAVIFFTLRNVPTPDEYYADVKDYLNTMLVLQNKANEAISNKDYFTACLNQQQVVDLALQHNVGDLGIDVDNILRLEELICGTEAKDLI